MKISNATRQLHASIRKRTAASAVAVSLLVCGCADMGSELVWVRQGATQNDFDRDMGYCRAQAWSVPNAGAAQLLVVQNGCMQGKGWHQQRQ
jgi:hypothetical protein